MRRTILGVLCAALVIMGAVAPATAGDDAPVLSRIVERGQINVGMTGGQPPFNVKAKDGSLIGYDVDLAELLADAMGVKLNIVVMKFDELLPALKEGKVDAVAHKGGGVVVLDYKTGAATTALEDEGGIDSDRFQLALYAFGLRQVLGEVPRRGVLVYLGDKQVVEIAPSAEADEAAATVFSRRPISGLSTTIRSPAPISRTPAGVPVESKSPRRIPVAAARCATSSPGLQSQSATRPAWQISPFNSV